MIDRNTSGAPLVRLLYSSRTTLDMDTRAGCAEMRRIVAQSAQNNARRSVTGAILFVRGTFIQVLEGEMSMVEEVFETICRDMRHKSISLVEMAPTDVRIFSEWSMARIGPGSGEVDLATEHAMDEVYQSLSVSPNYALRQMRALLDRGIRKAA